MQTSTPMIPTGWKTFEALHHNATLEGYVQISHYFSNDVPLWRPTSHNFKVTCEKAQRYASRYSSEQNEGHVPRDARGGVLLPNQEEATTNTLLLVVLHAL